ncbi:MAG: hypothetical protein M1839_001461 [Geoglossum umbratile]|nr:MAG: hypothetical protein M1839_001461 [Geoglossum umbratile]
MDSPPIDIPFASVSLCKLLKDDPKSIEDLLTSSRNIGFFYLDIRDSDSDSTLKLVDAVFGVAEELFQLSLEEKQKFHVDQYGLLNTCGYKNSGVNTGVLETSKDGFESWTVPENGLFSLDNTPLVPELVERRQPLFLECVTRLRGIGLILLRILSRHLDLQSPSLNDLHRESIPSTSSLGMFKYLQFNGQDQNFGQAAHTDTGTLTLLFTKTAGLQVLMPETQKWTYIQPRNGHIIVNIGDSLRFLSKGKLCSALHRVVPNERITKFSLVYFMRPEEEINFTDTGGRVWKSIDWHRKKFAVFRDPISEQLKGSYVTGRNGFAGFWDPADCGRGKELCGVSQE